MKIKADYEMTFSLDEIIVMADDNASYSGGRFARKWLDEIESNPTNFVQFVTQTIDEYDKSVPMDIDKKVAITDDDINAMQTWKESDWIFDGVLENYPKMATTVKKDGTISPIGSMHEVFDKGVFVTLKMTVAIDTDMLRYKLDMEYRERQKNERADRMAKAEQESPMQSFEKDDVAKPTVKTKGEGR